MSNGKKSKTEEKKEEKTERAKERIDVLSKVPEIWDAWGDLLQEYAEKARQGDAKADKMVSIIENAMAMSHGSPDLPNQFDTLYNMVKKIAAQEIRKRKLQGQGHLFDEGDIAHVAVLKILEQPAEYDPYDPRKIGFVAYRVVGEIFTLIESERDERLAKNFLATYLDKKSWKRDDNEISEENSHSLEGDSSANDKLAIYFKEMLRIEDERRELEKSKLGQGQKSRFIRRKKKEPERDENGQAVVYRTAYSPNTKAKSEKEAKKLVQTFVVDLISGKIETPISLVDVLNSHNLEEHEILQYFSAAVEHQKKLLSRKLERSGSVNTGGNYVMLPQIKREPEGVTFVLCKTLIHIKSKDMKDAS